MHGPNSASETRWRCLHRSPQRFLTAAVRRSESRQTTVSAEAGVSKRPFARLRRLPVSEPPPQGRSSRPTSSTPSRTRPSARSAMNSSPRWFPDAGEIIIHSPLPMSGPVCPLSSPSLAPLRDLSIPLDQRSTWFATGGLPPRNVRCSSLPGCESLWASLPDHRSESVTFRVARCSVNLLEPSLSCSQTLSQSTKTGAWRADFRSLFSVTNQLHTRAIL